MSDEVVQPHREPFLQRLIGPPLRFVRDWLEAFIDLQGFDRAVALAGQAFTTLIPLLIVYGAVVSKASGEDFADRLIDTFDLTGTSARNMRQAFAPPVDVESSVSGFGAVLLVVSALSFTRALQRLYQLAWDQPPLGVRAAKWGLIWLVVVIVVATIRPIALGDVHGGVKVIVSILIAGTTWLVTPYILLARRVSWRRLAPTALMTGVGMTGVGLASAIWMPHSVEVSAAQFGSIGIAFALLGWLVGYGVVLVVTAAGGRVIEQRVRGRREARAEATARAHPAG